VTSGSDIACVDPLRVFGLFGYALPTVAVGAPFELGYASPEDASGAVLTPQPAAGAFVRSTPQGFSAELASTGFVVWQGSEVLDFTNVTARPLALLGFLDPSAVPMAMAQDAGPVRYQATAGVPATLIVLPEASDGTTLAGSMECAFASSDPERLWIAGQGIVAHLAPLADGTVTVTATCMGIRAQVEVDITAAGAPPDAGEPTDGPGDDTSEDAGVDGGEAPDSDGLADGEGG